MDVRHVASGFDSSAPVVLCFNEAWLLLGKVTVSQKEIWTPERTP
jgi:hypothetical protein